MATVLVVAAHPDDEILGCGGSIVKHSRTGDSVYILIMAEGLTSRFSGLTDQSSISDSLNHLQRCAQEACSIVGAKSVEFTGLPDNKMDSASLLDIIKPIEAKIREVNPEIIYTHQPGCLNIDHQLTHRATVTAARALPGAQIKTLLFFESPSSSEWQVPGGGSAFVPNWFVDIEDTLELKLKALKAYDSEMRAFPHPRSYEGISNLAKYRGASAGFKAAEAFTLGRHLA